MDVSCKPYAKVALPPRKKAPRNAVTMKLEGFRVSQDVSVKRKSLVHAGDRIPFHPARSPVTIPKEQSRLSLYPYIEASKHDVALSVRIFQFRH
jgi:hypothetical protein